MNWIKAIVWKEISRNIRLRKSNFIPPVVTALLYFLVFWSFIWQKIESIKWFSYIDFIIPWLILMSVITTSYMNSSFSFFNAKFRRAIDDILVAPIPNREILVWYVLWWVLRWVIVWVLIYLVSLFFSLNMIDNIFVSLIFLILTSLLFSLIWFLNWLYAKWFDNINIIPSFVIAPMTYLWWVFYTIDYLPDFWRYFTYVNPVFYMINGLRYWFIWYSDSSVIFSLFMLISFILILSTVSMIMLNKWYWLKS